jgi:hypothetical protein
MLTEPVPAPITEPTHTLEDLSTVKKKVVNRDIEDLKKLTPYRDLGNRFRTVLKLHKSFITHLVREGNMKYINAIISSGEELAMVYAGFKCECCGDKNNLQSHHLIQKNIKYFIDSTKYISQRYYWANVSILCNKCHAEFHGFSQRKFLQRSLCIHEEKINKLKKLYNSDNLELNK